MRKILFLIGLCFILHSMAFAGAPVIGTPANPCTTIGLPTALTKVHFNSSTATVTYSIQEISSRTLLGNRIAVVDSGNGGASIEFNSIAGMEGDYALYVIATDTATGADQGKKDSVILNFNIADTSKHFHYIITEINNDPERAILVCNNGSSGKRITGVSVVDTSASIPIDKFSLYYTTYHESRGGTSGDTLHVVVKAQTSANGATWATVDSLYPAVNDTLTYTKTWTLPKQNYFRTLTYGRAGNDTSDVFLEHTFRK